MSIARFESLLHELSTILLIPGLKPDQNNSCLIRLSIGVQVQLELDPQANMLIIGADLGPVAIGKYRDNIFRAALKSNGLPPPRYGIIAFSKLLDHLISFEMIPLSETRANKLSEFIVTFAEKALVWQQALSKNEVPLILSSGKIAREAGMFGLQP